jgi:urocanate hydratase
MRRQLAIKNALRYFPTEYHSVLAPEFWHELQLYGHIYMYRFRPTECALYLYINIDNLLRADMKSRRIQSTFIPPNPSKVPSLYLCVHGSYGSAKGIQLMIMNNLDHRVAQYPHELVTYGGNGSVFSNWIQYHLVMKYLSDMTDHQTLAMYSGHPHGYALLGYYSDCVQVVS